MYFEQFVFELLISFNVLCKSLSIIIGIYIHTRLTEKIVQERTTGLNIKQFNTSCHWMTIDQEYLNAKVVCRKFDLRERCIVLYVYVNIWVSVFESVYIPCTIYQICQEKTN